jgi:hypothetical protein
MNILRRYQRGGFGNAGLNYSSSFSNPSSTGWKAPGNAPGGLGFGNASLNSASLTGTGTTKQSSGFDANQAMNYGTAALGAITGAIGTGMQAKAQIDMINEANRMGREQNLASAKSRVQNMRTSGNQYGTYGTMYGQYGGAVLGYGEDLDSGFTERVGQRAITEGTTEGIVSAIPVVGPIIGAATGLVKGVQSAAGKQRAELDGKMIDAYPDETAAAVGNTMKMFTPHQSAFDHAENEDYGRAVLSWTGLGVIPDMIEGMSDQRDYESQRSRAARQNFRTQGGTTGGSHLNNQELAMNAMQDRQIPTAKYGGYPMYKAGGMAETSGVPRYKANAELEDNEIVMKKGGSRNVKIDGPTHEQGGVPMKLEKGDYVWSDHLKDPQSEMSMAELYERLSKNGASEAEIRQLMQYQEQLAGRAPGQGMDQTAKNGGLMKYQTAGPFPKFNQTFNMFEDRPMGTGSVVTMKGMPVSPEIAARTQGKKIETPATAKRKTPPALNKQQMQAIPVKTPYGGSVGNQPPMQTIPTKGLPKNALPATLPMAYTPAPTTAHLKSAPDEGTDYLKYAPEAISGLGSLAAIIATATQDFDKVPIPQANRVKADRMFLDRMSPDAELARSQRDFAAMMAANLKMGQGPGASSTIQSAYSDKVRADEQARANADRLNIQIDATEKAGNIDSKMEADMFNEENMARYREMAFAQDTASEAFEREKTQAIVNQLLRGTQGVADTAMNRRYAEAVSGDTGALERFNDTSGLSKELKALIARYSATA